MPERGALRGLEYGEEAMIWSWSLWRCTLLVEYSMHAADDYDGSGNVDDDGRRGNERWSDCLPAYHLNDAASLGLPTLGWAASLVSRCQAGWAVLLTDIRRAEMSRHLAVSRKGWTDGGSSASHTNRDRDTNMAMWTGGTDERNTVHVAT